MNSRSHGGADRERGVRTQLYQEPHWLIFSAFLAFVVDRYMEWGARRPIFRAVRSEFTLGFVLAIVCVGLLISEHRYLKHAKGVAWSIVGLFAAVAIQLPLAADPVLAQNIFVDRVLKFAFLSLFMTVLIQSPRNLLWFLYAFLFACGYVTQESTRGLISGSLVWQNQGVMRLHGAVPIYDHPNSLSGLAVGALPFAVFLIQVWRRWYQRIALCTLIVTSLVCIIYTGSRTGYLGFLGFIVYWFCVSRRKLRWSAVAIVIALLSVSVLPAQYKDRFMSIGGKEAEGSSKEARLEIQRDAWAIFLEHPMGVGVASFPAVRMAKFNRFQDTHNLYLEVATNLGVQGLTVFLLLVGTTLRAFRKVRRELSQQRERLTWIAHSSDHGVSLSAARQLIDIEFLTAVCNAACGFVIVRLVLGVFGMDLYEIYWWFAAGLAISLLNLEKGCARETERITERVMRAMHPGSPA